MKHVAIPTRSDAIARDSIGGHPFLPADVAWPVCPTSGERMVLFFQFEIRPEHGVQLAAGSQLAVFMSPAVNEIDSFERVRAGTPLPERFWEKRLQHFKTFVFAPGTPLVAHPDAETHLVAHTLAFAADDDPSDPFLFVGGEPRWYQDAETHPDFHFVCQLSQDYAFAKQADAAEQPDSFSADDYCLFLGNSAYLFTRAQPAHREEVWVVLQN